MQRQKRILYQRLRVPPAVNQFTKTLQNNQSKNLWRLLAKYTPEAKKDKVARLRNAAQNKADGKEADTKKPTFLKFGLNHVTSLVESGDAKLVVIAHDVDPIELVLRLPQLCRNKNVPYLIVKDKARLGRVCRQSTASCVAITEVEKADNHDLEQLIKVGRNDYLETASSHNQYGAPVMGVKARHKIERIQRIKQAELMK